MTLYLLSPTSYLLIKRSDMVEVLFGTIAPLAVAGGSWVLTERTYRRAPARLTSLMIGAFAAKMVFFGAYVGIAIGVLGLRPVPFVASFTASFIVSHLVEALYMRRLFAGDAASEDAAYGYRVGRNFSSGGEK